MVKLQCTTSSAAAHTGRALRPTQEVIGTTEVLLTRPALMCESAKANAKQTSGVGNSLPEDVLSVIGASTLAKLKAAAGDDGDCSKDAGGSAKQLSSTPKDVKHLTM